MSNRSREKRLGAVGRSVGRSDVGHSRTTEEERAGIRLGQI